MHFNLLTWFTVRRFPDTISPFHINFVSY